MSMSQKELQLSIEPIKTACVIVIRNPEIELLQESLSSIINQIDKIILIDNASRNHGEVIKIVFTFGTRIEIVFNDINMGLSSQLNLGIKRGVWAFRQ